MALTTNKNFLSPIGFTFKIDAQFANTEYFCTQVELPGISLSAIEQPYKGVNLGLTGDRMTFDQLTITFNVTENLENYMEIYDWMHNVIQKKGEDYKYDARLMILSSHNNVAKTIKFQDIFPTNLSSISFNAQQSDIEYVQASVSFKYTYFEFE